MRPLPPKSACRCTGHWSVLRISMLMNLRQAIYSGVFTNSYQRRAFYTRRGTDGGNPRRILRWVSCDLRDIKTLTPIRFWLQHRLNSNCRLLRDSASKGCSALTPRARTEKDGTFRLYTIK